MSNIHLTNKHVLCNKYSAERALPNMELFGSRFKIFDCIFLCDFHQVKVVVFDKTGTLTYGRPEVNCVIMTVPEITLSLQAFFAVIGLAESSSEHPLGVAICNFARQVRYYCY